MRKNTSKKKKWAILHLESSEYIKPSYLKAYEGSIILYTLPTNATRWYKCMTFDVCELESVGIYRSDFSLKNEAIYFNDKVSATTFLRDLYIEKLHNVYSTNKYVWSEYIERKEVRPIYRNEFEIVEI